MTEPEEVAASILHDLHRSGQPAPSSVREAVTMARERMPRAPEADTYAVGDALYSIVERARTGTEAPL